MTKKYDEHNLYLIKLLRLSLPLDVAKRISRAKKNISNLVGVNENKGVTIVQYHIDDQTDVLGTTEYATDKTNAALTAWREQLSNFARGLSLDAPEFLPLTIGLNERRLLDLEEALRLDIELVTLEDPRDFAEAYQEDLAEGIIGVPGTIAMIAVDLKYLNAAGRAGVSGESFVSQIGRDMRLGRYEHIKSVSPTSTLRTVLAENARTNQEFVLFGPNAYCTPLSKGYGPRGDDDRPIGAKVIGHSIDITAGVVRPVNYGHGYSGKSPLFPFDAR
ncbi:MAG: hypothetical protein ISS01_02125 [Nanoarchaeota archaeon]|nr:hypothetical protein [Nanoarchaeota archaeon]